jgi:hypothetical protein
MLYIRVANCATVKKQKKNCATVTCIPYKEGRPVGHGRFNPRAKGDGYIGKVVNGSISQRDTLGCFSPAVDSSHPTYMVQGKYGLHAYN